MGGSSTDFTFVPDTRGVASSPATSSRRPPTSSASTPSTPLPFSEPNGDPTSQLFAALPGVKWNLHPAVKIKLRKYFFPLGVTRLMLGADYALDNRTVTFKWSWRDRFIGARLHFEGDEVSLSRRFTFDERTTIDARVGYDIRQRRTLFSFVVRPLGGIVATDAHAGLALRHKISLDKRLGLEAAARVRLPEARFSAGSHAAVSLGDGDFEVDLTELNFRVHLE